MNYLPLVVYNKVEKIVILEFYVEVTPRLATNKFNTLCFFI